MSAKCSLCNQKTSPVPVENFFRCDRCFSAIDRTGKRFYGPSKLRPSWVECKPPLREGMWHTGDNIPEAVKEVEYFDETEYRLDEWMRRTGRV